MRKISVLYIKKNVLVRGRTQFAPTRFVHHGLVYGKSDRARVAEVSDPYDWCAPTELVHRRWLGAEFRGRAWKPALTEWYVTVGLCKIFRADGGRLILVPVHSAKNALYRCLVQCVFRILMKCRVFISSRWSFCLPFSLRRVVLQTWILLFSPWGRRVLRFLRGMRIWCAKYHAHSR